MVKKLTTEPLSSEEEIAILQLERLKDMSRERLLTIEEVKMYDLLVKNLRLSKEKSETITISHIKPAQIDEQEMIDIASGVLKEIKYNDPEAK